MNAGRSISVTLVITGVLAMLLAMRGAPLAAQPPSPAATSITKLTTAQPVVALTFDAGADRGYTAQILDTLHAHRIQASFGLTGQWAEANPDLLARIAQEGHTIINHTYTHHSSTGYSTSTALLSAAPSYVTSVTRAWTKGTLNA